MERLWAAVIDEIQSRPERLTFFSELQSRMSPKAKKCATSDCFKANLCYVRSGTGTAMQGLGCDLKYATVARF